jgi:riboflavin kinase/FMN adenylyltransferase
MKILDSIEELSGIDGPLVLAAGTFDGLHLGHQALIRRAKDEASSLRGTAVVMTFDRHPATLLRPEIAPNLLTRNKTKISLLGEMGIQAILLLPFTHELASVPARDFITSLVMFARPLNSICVGSQWSFGKGGEGDLELLEILGKESGFSVIQIPPLKESGTPISSTRIRASIGEGYLEDARACLGRPYLLTGTVVSGQSLGKSIGFPTANLDVAGMQLPPDGVYAVRVCFDGSVLSGVCNIGVRPTVDSSASHRTVEAHLFDFSKDLVGKVLGLEFVRFLRGEQKFPGLDELKSQIACDCIAARKIL